MFNNDIVGILSDEETFCLLCARDKVPELNSLYFDDVLDVVFLYEHDTKACNCASCGDTIGESEEL